jgi:hypothetical protein
MVTVSKFKIYAAVFGAFMIGVAITQMFAYKVIQAQHKKEASSVACNIGAMSVEELQCDIKCKEAEYKHARHIQMYKELE